MNSNQGFPVEIIAAIMGIIGTLLGTFVGWLLNNISQSGKLRFFSSLTGVLNKQDGYGAYRDCSILLEADDYKCEIKLDIFNESANYKTIKNVQIRFITDNNSFCVTPVIKELKNNNTNEIVKLINIPPKQTVSLIVLYTFSRYSFDELERVRKVDLKYNNEKGKTKKVHITDKFEIAQMDFSY